MDFPPNMLGPIVAVIIGLATNHSITTVKDMLERDFRLLDRDLELKKNIGDTDASQVLDELIRMRLNSYVISEMNGRKFKPWNEALNWILGFGWAIFLMLTILSAFDKDYPLTIIFGILWLLFIIFWSKFAGKGRIREFEQSIRYKANLHDGKYDNYYVRLPLLRPSYNDNAPDPWQHSYIYIEDKKTGDTIVYEKYLSSGYVFSDSRSTNLTGEYRLASRRKTGKETEKEFKKSENSISSNNLNKCHN